MKDNALRYYSPLLLVVLLQLVVILLSTDEVSGAPVPMVKTINSGKNAVGHYAKATQAFFQSLQGVCSMNGEIYVSDLYACNIRKINKEGVIVPLAGVDYDCKFVDEVSPLEAKFKAPSALACDPKTGAIFVADDFRIRKIANGTVTTISRYEHSGETSSQLFFNEDTGDLLIADTDSNKVKRVKKDGTEELVVSVQSPVGVVQSNDGTIYISSSKNVIFKYQAETLQVIAGVFGRGGYVNGIPENSFFNSPRHLAIDKANELLLIADYGNYVVRSISLESSMVSHVAGNNIPGHNGDGIATAIQLSTIFAIHLQSDGNLLIVDNRKLRTYDGKFITTIIENKDKHFIGYDVPTEYSIFAGREMSVNPNKEIFVLNSLNDVIKFSNGMATKLLDFKDATNIAINNKQELFVGSFSSVYKISSSGQSEHYAFDENFPNGNINLVDNIDAKLAITNPMDVTYQENPPALYFTEMYLNRIRKLDMLTNVVSTVVGNGIADFSNNNIFAPKAIVITPNNDLIFSEIGNNVIRRKLNNGIGLEIIAGSVKNYGYTSNGKAVDSLINQVFGLFLKGNMLYMADTMNCLIRMVNLEDGKISDIAGVPTGCGHTDGAVDKAMFYDSRSLVVMDNGDIIVADTSTSVLRSISKGQVTTISGTKGYKDGPLGQSSFSAPECLELLSNGDILVVESGNALIRKISNGIVSTIAGTPNKRGFKGENVEASQAVFDFPKSVKATKSGTMYISDRDNNRIRSINQLGLIRTVAGGRGDGLGAKHAIASISEIAFTDQDEMLIADANSGIRKISNNGIIETIVGNGESGLDQYCEDGTAVLNAPLNQISSVSVCGGVLYFIERISTGGKLRYVKDSKIYTIGSAESMSCRKESNQLVVANSNQLYLLQSNNVLKLISGNENEKSTTDGPLSSTVFYKPILAFGSSGELIISERYSFNNLRIVNCENGYVMRDFSTCVQNECYGEFGVCNGNGQCNDITNQCNCNANFTGRQCEIMILSKAAVSFKKTLINLEETPKLVISFADFNFHNYYKGRYLTISSALYSSSSQFTHSSSVVVKDSSFELEVATVKDVGDYHAHLTIRDSLTGLEIISQSNIEYMNALKVSQKIATTGDNGAATAFAVIFALLSGGLGIALGVLIFLLMRKKKQLNPIAYEQENDNL